MNLRAVQAIRAILPTKHVPQTEGTYITNAYGEQQQFLQENLVNEEVDHYSTSTDAQLLSIALEPGQINRVVRTQSSAPELAKYRTIALSQDDSFEFRELSRNSVLYRKVKNGAQLVLPANRGFWELILEELHSSKLAGHIGVRKTIFALLQRI